MSALFKFTLLLIMTTNVLLSSAFFSWQVNAVNDYFYSDFYHSLDMDQHIKKYAIRNQDKMDYETVGSEEHIRVFSELVSSIHHHGIGLEDINYYGQSGDSINTLLNESEISHLYDVANLMTKFFWVGVLSCILTLILIVLSMTKRVTWPSQRRLFGGISVAVAAVIAAFLIIGFDPIFTLMHEVLFTSGATWTFAYDESLLIVLTKSPQYFAILGLTIFVPALVLFTLLTACLSYFSRR
ncbi:MAG: DUF1461 domain-containing protein [Pseudomonadota bacterium]